MSLRCGSLRQWHWISSAFGLTGLLFFALTGITLNHAQQLESPPQVTVQQLPLPETLHRQLQNLPEHAEIPEAIGQWLKQQLQYSGSITPVEWEESTLSVHSTRFWGEESLQLDRESGIARWESLRCGWINSLNNLHTNRTDSALWSAFIDLFAASCLIFALTGLWILKRHAASRPSTWPVTGLGLLIPVLVVVLLIH